ncbi:MAG: hypothetical protein E7626_03300 [Ruminococcaceae bacterium]|nr:hypothetical protein [Oscillospiraceae bacterium]
MVNIRKRALSLVSVILALIITVSAVGCSPKIDSISFTQDNITLELGESYQLETNAPDNIKNKLDYSVSGSSVSVNGDGLVTALELGKSTVTVKYKDLDDVALITVIPKRAGGGTVSEFDKDAFYGDYEPADSYEEALERSENGLISGSITVPDQEPTLSAYQPKKGNALIKNSEPYFMDENTYIVVDAYGVEAFRIYRGGGYITLEEVAAYVYAFGDVPANYVSSKNKKPSSSIWGEYLRLNHSNFSGSTTKYPYEPELPDISGCGGNLEYYEIDIGTTGTDCDPGYTITVYNDGSRITRGAARIVYARFYRNGEKITDPSEKYVFYTYNHYNDFQEYLNYYGGWGEMFGNITGGGELSSKNDYNPTPYIPTVPATLKTESAKIVLYYCDPTKFALYV